MYPSSPECVLVEPDADLPVDLAVSGAARGVLGVRPRPAHGHVLRGEGQADLGGGAGVAVASGGRHGGIVGRGCSEGGRDGGDMNGRELSNSN